MHSHDIQAIKTLASIYLKCQQSTLVIVLMKPIEELYEPYIYSMIAIAYEQLVNSEKSADYIEKSFQVAPDDQAIKRQFQITQLETGKGLDITFEDSNYTDYYQGGHLPVLNLFLQKKSDDALAIIQGYLKKQPKSRLLYYKLGSGYQYKGELKKAKVSFRQSIQLSETLLEPRINLARILVSEGDDVSAEKNLP